MYHFAGAAWGNNPIFTKTKVYNKRRQLIGMKTSLENTSNILNLRVSTTGKSTETEPRFEKNVVNALTLRFPHLKRDIQDQILALTSVEEAGGEEEIGVDSAGEGGSDSASEGVEEAGGEEEIGVDSAGEGESDSASEGEEESESESKGEDSAEHSDGGDEEAREQAKVPKKCAYVDMPSAARQRVFRKRQ
jgi:cobalamin biosynthesis protein CobT